MLTVGPCIGAVLITEFGILATLLVDFACFMTGVMLLYGVNVRRVDQTNQLSALHVWGDIVEGWRYVVSNRLICQLNLMLILALICTGLWTPLAPFFVREYLGGSNVILGWQLGLVGLGAAIGAPIATRLVRRWGSGMTTFIGFVAEGASLLAYSLISSVTGSYCIVLIWGVAVSIISVPFYSLLQRSVEDRYLGRVFSVVRQCECCAMVIAVLVAMVACRVYEPQMILLVAGMCYLVLAIASSLTRGGRMLLSTP